MSYSLKIIQRTPADFVRECALGLDKFDPPSAQVDEYRELERLLDRYCRLPENQLTFPDIAVAVERLWALGVENFVGSIWGGEARVYRGSHLLRPCESPEVGARFSSFVPGGFLLSCLYGLVSTFSLSPFFVEVIAPRDHFKAAIQVSIVGIRPLNLIPLFVQLMGGYLLADGDLIAIDDASEIVRFRILSPGLLLGYIRADKPRARQPIFTFRQPVFSYEFPFFTQLRVWPVPIAFEGTSVQSVRHTIPHVAPVVQLDSLFALYAGLAALYYHSES